MEMITITAKTLDEAITKASIELGTTSDNLDYQVIEKGSSGFLDLWCETSCDSGKKEKGIQSGGYSGEAKERETDRKRRTSKTSRSGTNERGKFCVRKKLVNRVPAEKPEFSKADSSKKVVDAAACEASARTFLEQVFAAMNMQVDLQISFDQSEKELSVEMSGTDMGILIGKRGQTLDSLQYLVSLVVNKDCEGYVRVKLDTENYRLRRRETLETLARNISYKVKRTKKPVSLEPMNPYERRIIHAALQNDRYVVTRSEGDEPFRHIVISLRREPRENKNRQ